MNYAEKIAQELNLRPFQATAAIELLDDGNTLPFVARYRKEATGSLDEEQLRTLQDRLKQLRTLDDRRETIFAAIEEQGKLTDELRQRLLAAETATELEDLYQPYKKKRRTRASMAKEKGLQPLADLIIMQLVTRQNEVQIAAPFLTDDVPTAEDALAGARDIVAETISDDANVRQAVRERALQWGLLQTQKIEDATDERNTYSLYYEFEQQIDRLRPYQVLAINRGETEKVLRVKVEVSERDWLLPVRQHYRPDRRSPLASQLQLAMEDAAKRLLLPAIERDVRRTLSEQAESHAIAVFGTNLRGLLTQPPLADQVVLAIDPAYRTGCKIAIMDATGKVLDTGTIYPHAPQNKRGEAMASLSRWVQQHRVTLLAIGNGTASRETEQMVAEFIQQQSGQLHYLMVNEAGASVYSASPLARAELPELDVTIRGAVSIGRRVQDPLAELVKIDPKSIGVGLYQHDVNQNELSEALAGVVETVVNRVGVDVNTASPALLTHVAGIGSKLAEKIVAHRDENGRFSTRQSLLKVSGLGAKSFEQAAGFLRVRDGDNPLDASAIHPESYGVATAVLKRARLSLDTPPAERESLLTQFQQKTPLDVLATELKTGVPTLKDILEQLVRPGRDPREEMPPPILRSDVLAIEDLQVGMVLNGTVRNVVDFGAFVDIGVKQDGLLHRTQIPRRTELNVGDVLEVAILSVDVDRKRISLGWVEG
ncbi:MAG: RNA-binding transcriptional accessory protein [Anaerolineales bacterium]|nr:RNA-binding transcriptional accessory protein [Anaerolineales bacterium]